MELNLRVQKRYKMYQARGGGYPEGIWGGRKGGGLYPQGDGTGRWGGGEQ